MTHNVLLKCGWVVIFEAERFTAYENADGVIWVKWFNGKECIYSEE